MDTGLLDPRYVADRLDREWGVMCSAGYHGTPNTHDILDTSGRGALRVSVGWSTTEKDVDAAVEAIAAVTAARVLAQ